MAILGFQEFMLPILKSFADNQEHTLKEPNLYIEDFFQLTEEERRELLPSGKTRAVYDRTSWALTYLKMALLVKPIKRGTYLITERGQDLLKSPPDVISVRFLSDTYPEFRQKKKDWENKPITNDQHERANDTRDLSPGEVMKRILKRFRKIFLMNYWNLFYKILPHISRN